MRYLLPALLLLLSPPLVLGAPRTPKRSALGKEFDALRAEHRKALAEFNRLRNAGKRDQADAFARKERKVFFLEGLFELARKGPKDPATFEAMQYFVLHTFNSAVPQTWDEAMRLLQPWAADPRMKHLVRLLRPNTEPTFQLLRKVYEKHPDKKARARAATLLLGARTGDVSEAEEVLAKPAYRVRMERRAGRKYIQSLIDNLRRNRAERDEMKKALKGPLAGLVPVPTVGKSALPVRLLDTRGRKCRLADLRGRVVLLTFLAVDHPSCDTVLTHQKQLARKFKGRKLSVVNVCSEEDRAVLNAYLKKNPSPWTYCWTGPLHTVQDDWNPHSLPTVYVLDGKGVIRGFNAYWGDLEAKLAKLLREVEKK
jgi:hypothetical protein